jgi:hypothetical protein
LPPRCCIYSLCNYFESDSRIAGFDSISLKTAIGKAQHRRLMKQIVNQFLLGFPFAALCILVLRRDEQVGLAVGPFAIEKRSKTMAAFSLPVNVG